MDNSVGVPVNDQRPVPSVVDVVLPIEKLSINSIKFNRLGTLIAAGAVNGFLAVIDFTTKETFNIWNAHICGITSICWSRDSHHIFSTGMDNSYVISDVESGTVLKQVIVGSGLISALMNPRFNNHVLINSKVGIKLTDLDTKETHSLTAREMEDPISTLIFDRRGKHVIAGTINGSIVIYDLNGNVVAFGAVDSPQTIRFLVTTKKLDLIVVVAADRYIRVYEFDELLKTGKEFYDTENRLSDRSNKTVWQAACASGEANYVAGMSATAHLITIFERLTGTIVATLCESKKEIPLSFDWHPAKPAIASVCNGQIFVWKQKPKPCWAAYAPHFTELSENMEYKEKESEFDQHDEDIPRDDSALMNAQEEFVDVDTVKASSPLCSSDDEDPNRTGTFLPASTANLAIRPMPSRPRLPVTMAMDPDEVYRTHYRRVRTRRRRLRFQNGFYTNGYGHHRYYHPMVNGYYQPNGHVSPVVNGHISTSYQNGDFHQQNGQRHSGSSSSSPVRSERSDESDEKSDSELNRSSRSSSRLADSAQNSSSEHETSPRRTRSSSHESNFSNRTSISSRIERSSSRDSKSTRQGSHSTSASPDSNSTEKPTQEDWDGVPIDLESQPPSSDPILLNSLQPPSPPNTRSPSPDISLPAPPLPPLEPRSISPQSSVSSSETSPPRKRRRSRSSSSESAVNHAWDDSD